MPWIESVLSQLSKTKSEVDSMKSTVQIVVAVVMVFGLAGCAQESTSDAGRYSKASKPESVTLSIESLASQDSVDNQDSFGDREALIAPRVTQPEESTEFDVVLDSATGDPPAVPMHHHTIFQSLGRAVQKAFSSVVDPNTSENDL